MNNFFGLLIAISIGLLFIKGGNCTVLGIDFGTEYIKSSLISPGKSFMIIEDMTSKRKTPSSVNILYLYFIFSYVFMNINAFMNMIVESKDTKLLKAPFYL